MKELKNGLLCINGILISSNDSLTRVLQKTINFQKIIKNENNNQVLYFENANIFDYFTTCTLFFSNLGKLLVAYVGFSMDDERNYNKKIFEKFIMENDCTNPHIFKGGILSIECEPHFKEYNIKIIFE
ncbi:MAG: hypothetical protein HUJ68_12800 [Clostridia bacterium]|nr:hypothetical protein [Clostridia bacterium]